MSVFFGIFGLGLPEFFLKNVIIAVLRPSKNAVLCQPMLKCCATNNRGCPEVAAQQGSAVINYTWRVPCSPDPHTATSHALCCMPPPSQASIPDADQSRAVHAVPSPSQEPLKTSPLGNNLPPPLTRQVSKCGGVSLWQGQVKMHGGQRKSAEKFSSAPEVREWFSVPHVFVF